MRAFVGKCLRRAAIEVFILLYAVGAIAQSPYSVNIFRPGTTMTATSQTSAATPLGTVATVPKGGSWNSGTIQLTGTALTTATFAAQVSTDNGTTYFAAPICTVAVTPSCALTQTATASGVYTVNLANVTHIRFVTSGTFTGTSINLLLTANPNASSSKNGGSGASGAPLPCSVAATNYPCLNTANTFTAVNTFAPSVAADAGIIQNTSTSGNSAWSLVDSSGTRQGDMGYSNSATGFFPNSVLIYAAATPINLLGNGINNFQANTLGFGAPPNGSIAPYVAIYNDTSATGQQGMWSGSGFNLRIATADQSGAAVTIGKQNGTGSTASRTATDWLKVTATGVNALVPIFNSAAQTVVNCATSGTATFSQPEQGSSYKVVMVHVAACLGAASYTFPTAFSFAPQVVAQTLTSLAGTPSTTAVTITGTTSTGFIELNGY